MNKSILNLLVAGVLVSAPLYPNWIKNPIDLSVWLNDNFTYQADEEGKDYWKKPKETVRDKGGDCIGENQMIWTKNGKKMAKDITYNDMILSYNFLGKKYEYKKIIKIWNKGIKQLYRVHFKNGTFIEVTKNHKMLIYENSQYIVKKLYELDWDKKNKIKVPTFKKLPYEIFDVEWLNEDLCFLIGHYLAEGFNDVKHIRTCGYECIDDVIPKLKRNNIPYSVYFNKKNLPIITYLKSEFKDYLKKLKRNSFDITLPDEFLNLPQNKLEKFIEGFLLGDGHYNNFNFKDKRYKRNKLYTLSTSSVQLAKDIQEIGLKLGKPYHIWKQENHKGFGKKPIWRISYNTNSWFIKNYGYSYLSNVSIKKIEKIYKNETYDFMIEDNHNFVMENGTIVHNCEDAMLLVHKILSDLKYEVKKVLMFDDEKSVGHAICVLKQNKKYTYYSNFYYYSKNKYSSVLELIKNEYPKMDEYQYVNYFNKREKMYRIINN